MSRYRAPRRPVRVETGQYQDPASDDDEEHEIRVKALLQRHEEQIKAESSIQTIREEQERLYQELWPLHFTPADPSRGSKLTTFALMATFEGIKARLDMAMAFAMGATNYTGGDALQQKLYGAIKKTDPLTTADIIHVIEDEFGLSFAAAIVPLQHQGFVLWLFERAAGESGSNMSETHCLGIMTQLTTGCCEGVLRKLGPTVDLPDPSPDAMDIDRYDNHRPSPQLQVKASTDWVDLPRCEVLPRTWLLPPSDANAKRYTGALKNVAFTATGASFEASEYFREHARLIYLRYMFVASDLCTLQLPRLY
jgi:hypothetical protein